MRGLNTRHHTYVIIHDVRNRKKKEEWGVSGFEPTTSGTYVIINNFRNKIQVGECRGSNQRPSDMMTEGHTKRATMPIEIYFLILEKGRKIMLHTESYIGIDIKI